MTRYEALVTDSPEYRRVHRLWNKKYGHPTNYLCEYCDRQARVKGWIHGKDPKLVESYVPMCRMCHNTYDEISRGECNYHAKLNEDDVVEIRCKYATGKYTQANLAYVYGVTRSTITRIINKTRWPHV